MFILQRVPAAFAQGDADGRVTDHDLKLSHRGTADTANAFYECLTALTRPALITFHVVGSAFVHYNHVTFGWERK